jgi:hypothetical protein
MEKEIVKLTNVLRRIARSAGYAAWANASADAASFCVAQYNRVLARLLELEPAIATLFTPLPENASLAVTRIAARELAAYFEDERPEKDAFEFAFGCRPRRAFRRGRGVPIAVRCE